MSQIKNCPKCHQHFNVEELDQCPFCNPKKEEKKRKKVEKVSTRTRWNKRK